MPAPADPSASLARAEIDQTIRLAQDEAERDISVGRLGFLLISAVMATVIPLTGAGANFTFAFILWPGTALAFVLWAVARRDGHHPWVQRLGVLFEVSFPPIIFYIGGVSEVERGASLFDTFLNFVAALMSLQLLNTLRYSSWAGMVTAIGGATSFLTIALLMGVWTAPMSMVVAMILLGGVVSWSGSRRARRALERFARLQLLRRYLPEVAVDRLLADKVDDALQVGGQQVEVTIVATDLRGFTALSESLTPAQTVEQLNAYHQVMAGVVRSSGGVVDKFIGDGMLAVFGLVAEGAKLAPSADAGAHAAVQSARKMLEALEDVNAARAAAGLAPLKMGIGVHTGPVVAGNIGAPGHRLEFTVIGDAVNTAARLEALTKELGSPVALSEDAARRLSTLETWRDLGTTTLRGQARQIGIFVPGPAWNERPGSG